LLDLVGVGDDSWKQGRNAAYILWGYFFTKVFFCAAFMRLQFGFVMFWRKDFGTKAAHKMLVKLTPVCIRHLSRIITVSSYHRRAL
jgi:hypothetical protein